MHAHKGGSGERVPGEDIRDREAMVIEMNRPPRHAWHGRSDRVNHPAPVAVEDWGVCAHPCTPRI